VECVLLEMTNAGSRSVNQATNDKFRLMSGTVEATGILPD